MKRGGRQKEDYGGKQDRGRLQFYLKFKESPDTFRCNLRMFTYREVKYFVYISLWSKNCGVKFRFFYLHEETHLLFLCVCYEWELD